MAIGIVVIAVLGLWSSASFAQETPRIRDSTAPAQRGTSQEEAACRPDVRRFCRNVPDHAGQLVFLACLKENRSKISKACRDVLARHGH
jgi:hypothetical protein